MRGEDGRNATHVETLGPPKSGRFMTLCRRYDDAPPHPRFAGTEAASARVSNPLTENSILSAYKARAAADPRGHAVAITWRARGVGLLVPALDALDAAELDQIAAWRNRSRGRFFSEQEVSGASTGRWLAAAAAQPDRLIFLITTGGAGVVGHIGLRDVDEARKSAEADAWLGIGDERVPGIMLLGLAAMVRWSFEYLGLECLTGRVFADNLSVVRAYEAMLGSRLIRQTDYVKRADQFGISWQEGDGPSPRKVSHYQLDRPSFCSKTKPWL